MVAGGFGIAAQLPYLKLLVRGYNGRRVRALRNSYRLSKIGYISKTLPDLSLFSFEYFESIWAALEGLRDLCVILGNV
jgi:hypothetical protein